MAKAAMAAAWLDPNYVAFGFLTDQPRLSLHRSFASLCAAFHVADASKVSETNMLDVEIRFEQKSFSDGPSC